MKKRTLLIGIKANDEYWKEAHEWARRIDQGLPVPEPVSRLYFEDQATFFRNLSSKRLQLVLFLRKIGPMSIKQLATSLRRDYKNVHTDVQVMIRLGLIKTNRKQLVHVPWDDVVIELALAA